MHRIIIHLTQPLEDIPFKPKLRFLRFVQVGVAVADTHVRVDPRAQRWGKRIVSMDEAAFGAFHVVGCEGVGDAAEAEGVCWAVEGGGGHGYDA